MQNKDGVTEFIVCDAKMFNQLLVASYYALDVTLEYHRSQQGSLFIDRVILL